MKLITTTILVAATLLTSSIASFADDLAERLQNLSVTVHAGGAQGSGVIITRGGTNYILSAAHVVEGSRRVVTFHDNATGGSKKLSKFDIVTVVKEIIKDGKSIGKTEIEADVIAYSSPKYGDDLVLLKLRDNITKDSIKFTNTKDRLTPPVGTKLSHVGSFLGQHGSNSYSEGRISQIGRVLYDHVFDQTDVIAFPGSSGGGIFLQENGEYVGTLVRGAGQGYILYVPIRRIETWAKAHNIEFILQDNAAPTPNDKIKLELLEPDDSMGSDENSIKVDSFEGINRLFPYLLIKSK
jgi:hypothetical protein